MGQRKKKLIKVYIWLMFGALLSIAIGMMRISGSSNVKNFFDQGEVYEFAPETFTKSTTTWNYDPEFAAYFMSNENAKKTLPEIKMYRSWTYIGLNVAALNRESAEITFSFYDKMGTNLWEQTSVISEGDNLISIQHPLKFRKVKMIVRNQPGLTMAIRSMQLKDTDLGFSVKEFVKAWVVFMVLYLTITGAFFAAFHVGLRERNWYTLIEILQYSYILFGNYFGKKWVFALKQKTRKHIRTGLF
ncbi:MAG: hypothetical protein HFI37_09200, partial [Lachnospiraceae bacterium]|nr:hypothetical protein [Lachnospiraceae bacterium]